jgi:hypothetical protein
MTQPAARSFKRVDSRTAHPIVPISQDTLNATSRPCSPILLLSISLVRPNLIGQSKRRVRLAPYVLDGDAPGQLGQRQPAKLAIDLEHAEVGDYLAGDPHPGERERTFLEDLAPAVLVGVVCHHDDLRGGWQIKESTRGFQRVGEVRVDSGIYRGD